VGEGLGHLPHKTRPSSNPRNTKQKKKKRKKIPGHGDIYVILLLWGQRQEDQELRVQASRVAQLVDVCPASTEPLSSNSSTKKKEKKK
jgi:hypothetical protein